MTKVYYKNFSKRLKLWILGGIFFGIFLLGLGISLWKFYSEKSPLCKTFQKESFKILVFIPKGKSIWDVSKILENQKIISNKWLFLLSAFLKGDYNKIKAGEYVFSPCETVKEILQKLVKGKVYLRKIVIPEGYTSWQIAKILQKNLVCNETKFLNLVSNKTFASSLGIPFPSCEGFLFPDTYYFSRGTPCEKVIKIMVHNFWKHWKTLEPLAKKKGLTLKEVVILASIVEKEGKTFSEKRLIASVYLNRLKRGMPLQADPTINYALKNFRRLFYKDYQIKSPYNTYRYPGLPPTPVSNPGEESLKAVLTAPETSYLFFVSAPNGTTYFSRTYKEHLKIISQIRKKFKRFYEFKNRISNENREKEIHPK